MTEDKSKKTTDKPDLTRRNLAMGIAAAPLAYGVITSALGSGIARAAMRGTPVALITGSSSGFGYVSAKTLAENGYHVIASMREVKGRNGAKANELLEFARDKQLMLDVVEIDVDSDESVKSGMDDAMKKTNGRVDVLFNNAGINVPGPIELSMDAARQNFETNVFGQLRMLRAVAPTMRKNHHGLIIQMSSGLGRLVIPTSGMYCATKFAQEAMFESAAYELHPFGLEVAIIQPSDYDTQIKPNSRRYFNELMSDLNTEDKVRAKDYAQHIEITKASMEDTPAPNPQEVADIVLKLSKTPAGQRPLRQVAMPPDIAGGMNELNGTLEGIQTEILQGSGMGDLLTLARK